MNGAPEASPAPGLAQAGGSASSSADGVRQPAQNETAPLLPRENKDQPRCWFPREAMIVCLLLAALVVFAVVYFERRPHRLETVNLERLSLDVGLDRHEVVEVAAREIKDKPRNDKRRYQYATLPNGLQVLNVQDSESLKTSFAMAVKAGSYDDPLELPGLAHFCEHMLFLGTRKFPNPSGFDDFMAKSGGEDNAYTASEVTVYYGELSQAHGKEGLERFADFFRAPLFDRQYVKKEVHAIDSEHNKNVENPMSRIMQALNSLASTSSPVGRFHTGNIDTLYNLPHKDGKDPVDALLVYFQNRYCPKQMRLVTFGPSSPAEQMQTAAKMFGPIKKGSAQCSQKRTGFATPAAWPADRLGKWMGAQGTQPQAQLWVHFPLPDVSKDYLSQPLEYLDYVMGYQGEDSLSRVLQDTLGLATSASVAFDMASTGTSVYFVATLTPLGSKHPESVLDVLYSYIAELRNAGVDEALYDTIANVMKLKWDWSEPSGPSSTTSDLAERMTRLPIDKLLSGDTRIDQPDHQLVESLLERLTPDNMNVAFVDPNYTKHPLAKTKLEVLPYYGVNYSVAELSAVLPGAAKLWSSWLTAKATTEDVKSGLAARLRESGLLSATAPVPLPRAPRPIDDVPREINLDNMHVKNAGKEQEDVDEALFGPRPTPLALSSNLMETPGPPQNTALRGQRQSSSGSAPAGSSPGAPEVWYRSGWVTNSPKVTIQLDMRPLRLPDEEASAQDSVRLGLYSRLLSAEIAPKMADLTATGVHYDISVSPAGLSFSFGGFAPMMPRLVDTVLSEFNRFNGNLSITAPSRFERVAEELRQELTTYTSMPISYAIGERSLLLSRDRHSNEESLEALKSVTLESAAISTRELLLSRPLQLTSLAMGNLDESVAKEAVEKVWGGLQRHLPEASTEAAAGGEVERVAPVVMPTQPIQVRAKNPRPNDPNDATVVTLMWGTATVESRVVLGLLGQILHNLAYNELRTSRQLGYVVDAGSGMMSNVQFLSTIVQGTELRADDVEAAIEYVLAEMMPKRLSGLKQEEFDSFVNSFRQELLQPPLSPGEEVSQYWGPVRQGGQCFDLRGEILKFLNSTSLTRQSLADAWATLATPPDGVRKKIVVKYFAGSVPEEPQPAKAYSAWRKANLSEASAKRLLRERQQALVLGKADSAARLQLAKDGGYYAKDLSCRYEPEAHASKV